MRKPLTAEGGSTAGVGAATSALGPADIDAAAGVRSVPAEQGLCTARIGVTSGADGMDITDGAEAADLPAFGPVGRVLRRTAQVAALAGGLLFVGLVVMVLVSVIGRKLASAPVPGDVEVLQMCAAVAASTFFAWCHLNGSDVRVDFFTERFSAPTRHRLDAFGSLLVGAFGFLIAWRTAVGAWQIADDRQTSAILGWPVWVPIALMVPGFALLGLAGFYRAVRHWQQAARGSGGSRDSRDSRGPGR